MKTRHHQFAAGQCASACSSFGHTRRWFVSAIAGVLCAPLLATAAFAESELVLPYPTTFETVAASTFDAEQHRLGEANLVIEKIDGGRVRLLSESGVDGGARTIAMAELVPIGDGQMLRLVSQSSRSFDASGSALGILEIDHIKREGSCSAPGEDTQIVSLPENDRVANVPLPLLFAPLVNGTSESIDFQVLLCRGGARLMDFQGSVARREQRTADNPDVVEVRYGPNLGMVVSFIAKAVMPKLSFWFDPASPSRWLAHRMPLYSDGPDVFVVRQGIAAKLFME